MEGQKKRTDEIMGRGRSAEGEVRAREAERARGREVGAGEEEVAL